MNAGREAIEQRPLLHQRRHRVAERNQRRAENDRRIAGLDLVGELDRNLRATLVVVKHEFKRLAMNAAIRIRRFLELLKRQLFRLAEEGAAAGQRQDDVDLAIGGLCRSEPTNKCCGDKNDADAQSILPELRFRSSQAIAAASDANFGIKGAPATYLFQCGFEFEVPMTNLPQHRQELQICRTRFLALAFWSL